MVKKKGFLLAEACVALFIAAVSVEVLFYCLGQTKVARQGVEQRLERAYAWHVLHKTDRSTIKVRNHVYQLHGNKQIQDAETGIDYAVH
ncbi:MAG: hypothetical protein LKG31_01430 [Lactobacillus sp.]|nr:hypothetical protein [Lactobacillus sp.]